MHFAQVEGVKKNDDFYGTKSQWDALQNLKKFICKHKLTYSF